MDMIKILIDAYMKPLYDTNPSGNLLEAIQTFEQKLYVYGRANPDAMDIVGESGNRDEYNQLYMAAISGGAAYEAAPGSAEDSGADDSGKSMEELIDEQIAAERERLTVKELTAEYRKIYDEFMEACDPNYEITVASVKATLGTYQDATCAEEITYMSAVAGAVCEDVSVKTKLKTEMVVILTSLITGWENSKKKIRENDEAMDKYAQAMVVTRRQTIRYYRFLTEDMGITFDDMINDPFSFITMLQPQGLDSLWRIKKVMHPDNIKAMRYVLFEEILSGRPLTDILLTPQQYPFYGVIDSAMHPEIDAEFLKAAETMNKGISFFGGKIETISQDSEELHKKTAEFIAMNTSY